MRSVQIGAAWFPDATEFPEVNGLNRYFNEFVSGVAASGDEVTAAAFDVARRPEAERLIVHSLGTKTNGPLRRLRTQRECVSRCLATAPDIAAFHYVPSAIGSLRALGQVPLVCHFHGRLSAEHRFEGRRVVWARALDLMERAAFRRAQHFVVLSNALGNLLVSAFGVDPQQVSVVPGGVDAARFRIREGRRDARTALGLPTDGRLVVAVRQMLHRKGLSNLIGAAADIVAEHPDVSFALIGSGPLESALRRRVARMGLAGNVSVVGWVPDDSLPLWYRAADLTVLPTVAFEGFGLSAIESLAAGTPAIGTPVDGLREALEPLSPALVLSGSSQADLGRGLAEALRGDRPLPDAAACVRYVVDNFDWAVVVARVREVYEQVLADAGRSRT